jgi:cell division protein FtsQ
VKRSKGNRRKTVKQRKQFRLPKIRINLRAVFLPPLLIAVTAGVLFAAQTLLDRPVNKLQLEGAFQRVTPIQVEAALAPALDSGFLTTDLTEMRRLVATLDWIDEVEVARVWPDTLAVRVSEHQAAARWGETGLLNTHGELFTDEARYEFPELPRLAGPRGGEGQVAEQYLALRGRLAEANLQLEKLSMDDRGAWLITLSTGQEIRLGRHELEQRVDRLFDVVVPALAPEMNRVEYVDLRYTNGFSVGWFADPEIQIAELREGAGGG